jgi:hypothetical protein
MLAIKNLQKRAFSNHLPNILKCTESGSGFDWRLHGYHTKTNKNLSLWHDLALEVEGGEVNERYGIFEITQGTTAKLEVDTEGEFNPIK